MHGKITMMVLMSTLLAPAWGWSGERENLLAQFTREAQAADSGFQGFSAARGEKLFRAAPSGGKSETPACTTCHGDTPGAMGKTRAGKPIDPMAVSRNPERYTDPAKVAKWFGRNCDSVLGRECTPLEKGDFLTYMMAQ